MKMSRKIVSIMLSVILLLSYVSMFSIDITAAKTSRPTIKNVESTKVNTISVNWSSVSGYTKYQVSVSTNKEFNKNVKNVSVKNNKTQIKNCKGGKTYYVRVRTEKIKNGKKVYGEWSKIKSVKVKKKSKPSKPSGTTVYVSKTGTKYHSISKCGNMKTAYPMTEAEAISKGYTRCSKCW